MHFIAREEIVILESPDPRLIPTCSPGICRLPGGRLVVTDGLRGADSDDIPEPKYCERPGHFWQGQVFTSDDGGRTWDAGVELPPFSGVLTACDGEFHLGGAFVVHG